MSNTLFSWYNVSINPEDAELYFFSNPGSWNLFVQR